MPHVAGRLDPAERARLDLLLGRILEDIGLTSERVAEGAYLVTLEGEHKLRTMTWLVVQDTTLLVEAFFMRKPAENEGGTYRFLLGRNSRMYGVHFCVDRIGDVYLTGRLALEVISPEEIDRVLGCVRTYSDENFDPAVALGFAGAIEREKAWRAKLAASGAGRRPDGVGAPGPEADPRR